jgi:hypothetical protein
LPQRKWLGIRWTRLCYCKLPFSELN